MRADLATRDADKYRALEQDPCSAGVGRGRCTRPGTCTCACRRRATRDATGAVVNGPYKSWTLAPLLPGVVFGSSDCVDGFEGARNADGTFASCHLAIYVPSWLELNLLPIAGYAAGGLAGAALLVLALQDYLRRRSIALRLKKRKRSDGRTGTGTGTGTGTSASNEGDSDGGSGSREVTENTGDNTAGRAATAQGAASGGGGGGKPASSKKAAGWGGILGLVGGAKKVHVGGEAPAR